MKSTIKKLVSMLESFLSGNYDAFQFSYDFPDFCYKNYDNLESEFKVLGYYLDQTVPDICDEGEPCFDSTHMKGELQKVYQKVKSFIKD